MKVSLLILMFLSFSVPGFAGGSASRQEILSLIHKNLAHYLVHHYELAPEGKCVRIGNHLPDSGKRVLPCSIGARSRESGRIYTIILEDDGGFRRIEE